MRIHVRETFLVVHWLTLHAPSVVRSLVGWGTKIPHGEQCVAREEK